MLTNEQIVEYREIVANSDICQTFIAAGDDISLAKTVSSILPPIPKEGSFVGERGIYAILGVEAGETFIQIIEELATTENLYKSIFKRVERWIKDGIGLDLGLSMVQSLLLSFSSSNGGPFSDDSVAKLITYGSQSQIITPYEVGALR
jgi:hypothetical protein